MKEIKASDLRVGVVYHDTPKDNKIAFVFVKRTEDALWFVPLSPSDALKAVLYQTDESGMISFVDLDISKWYYDEEKHSPERMPNGLNDWAEIHHEIVSVITETLERPESEWGDNLRWYIDQSGTGGMYELGIDLTWAFACMHQDTVWGEDLDWSDTLEEFINSSL
jgi:hypothetical protein